MTSFLEELKKFNLQEGINKTGAGFQLPQIQSQVPQVEAQNTNSGAFSQGAAAQVNPMLAPQDLTASPQVPQVEAQIPQVEAQGPEGKYGNVDLSSAANVDLGGGEFHSQFPATSPMLDPRRDTGSFAGTGSGIILDVPQNLPQDTSSGTGGFAGAEEVVSSVTPKPSPAADSSGVFDPARVDDVDPFSANTGVDRLPQQYLGDADTTGGVQPQTPQVQAPTDGLTTQSGIPLSQFLSGEAIPEAGLRAEAPVFSSESRGISGVAGQDIMARASAEREARAEAQFGQVRGPDSSDRERRMASGEGTSMADLTDMAKANARGASPRDVARGQKIADELGVDLKTGQPLEASGGVSAKDAAEIEKTMAETAKIYSELSNPPGQRSVGQDAVDKALGEEYANWGNNEVNRLSALNSIKGVSDSIRAGAVDTGNWMEQLPVVNERFRNIFNPSGSDAIDRVRGVAFQSLRETLGAQFTEKESENLVKTYFNPTLGPEANLKRLDEFTTKLEAAYQAKSEMMEYFGENKTERGFQSTGKSKDIMNSLLSSSSSSSGAGGGNRGGGTEVGSQGLVITEVQ